MKTRKQKTPVSKRARQRPAKRRAAPRRPAAAGKTKSKASRRSGVRNDGSLTLAAECTVAEAEALKSELVRRLDESGPVAVDVSALHCSSLPPSCATAARRAARSNGVAGRRRWRRQPVFSASVTCSSFPARSADDSRSDTVP
jgi:hypothetical protein